MSPLHSAPHEPETEQHVTYDTAETEQLASSNLPTETDLSSSTDSDTAEVLTPATVETEQSASLPDINTNTEQPSDADIDQTNSPALVLTETPTTATEPLPTPTTVTYVADLHSPPTSPIQELGRGLRAKSIPAKLQDYVLQTITPHRHFLAAISSLKEPTSYRQAILDEIWRNSIKDEYVVLEENGTWVVVHLPPDKHALSCK
ncbi:mucin-2-like [Brassica napus]|uniref:mucin-2-like n=1 Tax=Brassica oleracea var. oleracea TaxID=109376 RepID=UPI0006A6DBF8|nr:PREDICTED: mucin-2-like [Brassica oleracea var. oleracea]XP_048605849.1 mucin-2-like [Brassica napus]